MNLEDLRKNEETWETSSLNNLRNLGANQESERELKRDKIERQKDRLSD